MSVVRNSNVYNSLTNLDVERVVIIRRNRSVSESYAREEQQQHLKVPEIKLNDEPTEAESGPHKRMRTKLRWFFMSTCDKYRANRTWPTKLLLQLLKVLLVTVQLSLFESMRTTKVEFLEGNVGAFKSLYLKDWDLSYEAAPYPKSFGTYSVFTVDGFYDSVNFALERYTKTDEISVGPIRKSLINDSHPGRMHLHLTEYQVGDIWTPNEDYFINLNTESNWYDIGPLRDVGENATDREIFDVKTLLKKHYNRTVKFDRLVTAELCFKLKAVHFKSNLLETPECISYDIKILYDNNKHSGRIPVTLVYKSTPFECQGRVIFQAEDRVWNTFLFVFDVLIIAISLLSMFLCVRSLIKAYVLQQETVSFFSSTLDTELSVHDRMEFLNLWYILILINDALTIAGTCIKFLILIRMSSDYEMCSVLLGTGNLLVWFGVLRYLSFFNKYNVLILTIKRAFPSIVNFLVCVSVITLGFSFCGWAVLGPYHIKFRSMHTSLECLFSLMNGDELYVTFATIKDDIQQQSVWWYCRIYLYFFICLYIYCILSLVVAIIMDSYDTVKFYYKHGFPQSELWKFIDQDRREKKSCEDLSDHRHRRKQPWWSCGSHTSDDEEIDMKTKDVTEKSKLLKKKKDNFLYTL